MASSHVCIDDVCALTPMPHTHPRAYARHAYSTVVRGRIPLGATYLKRRHMSELGVSLYVIPYWEWDRAITLEDKVRYLPPHGNVECACYPLLYRYLCNGTATATVPRSMCMQAPPRRPPCTGSLA